MAYTISIVHATNAKTARVVACLKTKINEMVSVGDWQEGIKTNRQGEKRYVIEMRSIRLREAKLYCGQHAGPCVRERKLKKSRCLETHYVFNPGTRSQFENGSGVETEEVYEEVA